MTKRRAAAAVVLAALGCLAWCRFVDRSGNPPAAFDYQQYPSTGAPLIYRVKPPGVDVLTRMPLSCIPAAWLQSREWLSARVAKLSFGLVEGMLIFALGCVLEPVHYLMPAAGLALTALATWDNARGTSGSYWETSSAILILLVACVLVWRCRRSSPRRTLVLALAVGVSLSFRSTLAFFPPFLAAYEWLAVYRPAKRAYWKQALVLCLAPYLLLIPWMWLTWTLTGRVSCFEVGTADGVVVDGAVGQVKALEGDWRALVDDPEVSAGTKPVLTWALLQVARRPARYLAGFAERLRFAFLLRPDLLALAFLGVWFLRRREEARQLGLLVFYFIVVHCLMAVSERYFYPIWPVMAVLAAGTPAAFFPHRNPERFAGRRWAPLLAWACLAALLVVWLGCSAVVAAYGRAAAAGRLDNEAAYDRAVALHPGFFWLREARARSRLLRGDVAGAAADLAVIRASDPSDAQSALLLAWARMLEGRPEDLLNWQPPTATGRYPAHELELSGRLLKAHGLVRFGRGAEASRELAAAVVESRAMSGFHESTDAESAVRVIFRADRSLIDLDSLHVAGVDGLLATRPYRERIALLERLKPALPGNDWLPLEQAALAGRFGAPALSRRYLAHAARLPLGDDERRFAAQLYTQLQEYPEAQRAYRELVVRFPDDAGLQLEMAEAALRGGDKPRALESLAAVEALAPPAVARRRLGDLYLDAGDAIAARRVLEPLAPLYPRDAELRLQLAAVAAKTGDRSAAVRLLAEAAGAPALPAETRHRIALRFQGLKEYQRALALLRRLTEETPESALYWADLGLAEYLAGDAAAAVAHLEAAIARDPRAWPAYLTLGSIYSATGRAERARELYDAALAVKYRPADVRLRGLIESVRSAR